jgi:hypothetical protein
MNPNFHPNVPHLCGLTTLPIACQRASRGMLEMRSGALAEPPMWVHARDDTFKDKEVEEGPRDMEQASGRSNFQIGHPRGRAELYTHARAACRGGGSSF